MDTQRKMYDVRVIRYIKARPETGPDGKTISVPLKTDFESFCKRKQGRQYVICLSHFDYLVFDHLSESPHKSPLDVIDQDRKSQTPDNTGDKSGTLMEDNYTYPLYMLKQIDSDATRQEVSDFWEQKSDYTSVVRIHYRGSSKGDLHLGADFFVQQMIAAGIKITMREPETIKVEVPVITGENPPVEVDVLCLVYDSLELGDSVVILKSSSMTATLHVSRMLNKMPCVLDCYTYIGISPELFADPAEHKNNQRDRIKLNSASTRFTVKTLKAANDYFGKYFRGEEIGFITGTTDARIRWKGDASGNLSEQIFLGKIAKLDPDNPEFHQAFRDVITRTGIEWPLTSEDEGDQPTEFSSDYGMLFDENKTPAICWFSGNGGIPLWLKNDDLLYLSLKKLLGAIQAMGQDGVMDALAELLIPSMRALFSRLYELKDCGWNPAYKGSIEGLLQDYNSLIQNISQLESQLVQHPEIYPVPYYIPAAVLQFELQFTRRCSELFRDMDDDKEKKYVFLPVLIPKYQSDASTIAPLDPGHERESVGVDKRHDGGERISPLRIYLPIKLLYRPHEAAHQLCHELAHYCGDTPRNREARFEAFCTCCAAMLMASWEEMIGDKDVYIDWGDSTIKGELNLLRERIKSGYRKNKKYYLTDVREHLLQQIQGIGLNPRYYEYFHNILFVHTYASQSSIIRAKIMTQQSRMNAMAYTLFWYQHIDYLKDIFRECYADLAMLKLLDSSAKTYCEGFYESFENIRNRGDIISEIFKNSSLKRQVDRLAFVLYIMGDAFISAAKEIQDKPIPVQYAIEQAELLKELSDAVLKNHDGDAAPRRVRWNGEVKNDSTMTEEECRAIVGYLRKCKQTLDQKLEKLAPKKLEMLRAALKATSPDGFDWAEVQEFVWNIQHTSCKRKPQKVLRKRPKKTG